MLKQYGINSVEKKLTPKERHIEDIRIKGFTIVKDILSNKQLDEIRISLDKNCKIQEEDFSKENLEAINELDILRVPLAYDTIFLDLITNNYILDIVKSILGDEVLLHLQNGIINKPNKKHHQSSWHRDLPYQEYIISKPLGISAFYCIDLFTKKTGSTVFLPYSHKEEKFPSLEFVKENQLQIEANPGDVILFNVMVYHKAGFNSSNIIRRGVNNVFVSPLIKQQINLPNFLKEDYKSNPTLYSLLGYKYKEASSVLEYRNNRLKRKNAK